jgi:NADPH-dependent 2,4-dienoyl-CoA reductase/sulfur reductase-like enzyme
MVAGYAAKEFVERGLKPGELAIVSADSALPYERPPLSKGFLRGADPEESVFINPASFYRDRGIDVRLATAVDRVDLAHRRLRLRTGGDCDFEKLLIATGSRVRTLKVPGSDLDGIFYLRSLDDSRRIRDRSTQAKSAVVIGGGFIGMEAASSLSQRGVRVTLVLAEDRIWQRLFTPELSAFFRDYYEARGVKVRTGRQVSAFRGAGAVEGVETSAGDRFEADMVVAGIGVVPETELFEGTGIEVENGIRVNEFLETNIKDVYAAGDVARYRDVLFATERRVEHWDNAVSQGAWAARVMTGAREPFVHVPYFFSDVFDLSYEFWGDSAESDAVTVRGNMAAASFSVWWLKDKRVVAAFLLARSEEEREFAQKAIRERLEMTPEAYRKYGAGSGTAAPSLRGEEAP